MESSISENTDSHFQLPPSDNANDTQEGDSEVVVKVHTHWSCATREHLKLLRCASDPHQLKIHTYFQVSGVKLLNWFSLYLSLVALDIHDYNDVLLFVNYEHLRKFNDKVVLLQDSL